MLLPHKVARLGQTGWDCMQRLWSADELGEHWSLRPEDLVLLADMVDAGKLGFAAQLAFWRQHGRYAFILPDQIARGELRPLRDPRNSSDEG